MFTRPFDSAASFAATGYDSALNLFTAFPVPDLAASLTDASDPTRFNGLNPQFLNQSRQSGKFTVGSSGQLQIDYLFDGGVYQGELALFNLSGLEALESGSTAFIQEAARRALSGSDLGYVLIQDGVEGAKFSGVLPHEGNLNAGSYLGTKRFSLTPGTEFGLMLVPNGTVQHVFDNPGIESAFHPLFSWAGANRNATVQLGQWSDDSQGASLFAWEDLQVNEWSDRDFNDLVFRLDGAIGSVPILADLINPLKDWRGSGVGQQIAASEPFNIDLVLGDGFSESQKAIIAAATRSVESMITQGLPDGLVDGQWVDDVRFQFSVESVDGSGGVWARSRLERLREESLLPIESITELDGADLAELERSGKLFGVVQHELLEGLGLGTLWQQKGLVDELVGQYIGTQAVKAFHQLGGVMQGVPVQRSSAGGSGLYWHEVLFQNEVMTANIGFQLDGSGKWVAPVSPVTLAALEDLGYQVDMSQATSDYALLREQEGMRLQFPVGNIGSSDNSSSAGWVYGGEEDTGNTGGQPTIFWRNYVTGENIAWSMDGIAIAVERYLPTVPDTDWVIGALGDFSGDGKIDILWRHQTSGINLVWQMDGMSLVDFRYDLIAPTNLEWRINGTGDFNQDGVLDILWRNYQTGETLLWLREGSTGNAYSTVTLPQLSLDWAIQGVGDFTGDGQPDILWRNYADGSTLVWQMNGESLVDSLWLPDVMPSNWLIQAVADFNCDGKPDILWQDDVQGTNLVWLMDGLVRYAPVQLVYVLDSDWQIQGATALSIPPPSDLALAVGDGWMTGQSTPMIIGLAVPGTIISLYANEMLVGKGQTGLDGIWRVTSSPLAHGSYSLTATATDTLGLMSQSSVPLEIMVDTTAPQSPQVMISPDSATWYFQSHFRVNYPNPTISGTTEFESLIQFYQDGTLIAQPIVDANGDWHFTPSFLADGTYTFTADATDAAGNRSPLSTPLTITVDATVPVLNTLDDYSRCNCACCANN